MIAYLVSSTDERGIKEAESHGWTRIARSRFVTPARDDVRVVSRMLDLVLFRGGTNLIKGADFEDGPENEAALDKWVVEKERFEKLVETGEAKWVPMPTGP